MHNIERIAYMEKHLNDFSYALSRLEDALDQFTNSQTALSELRDYYGSEAWYDDRASDDEGALPATLERGVLTEDLIYNAIIGNREVA